MQNSGQFFDFIITKFYEYMHIIQKDNYDYDRFSFDSVDRSKQFNVVRYKAYLYFLINHNPLLFEGYQLLNDDISKQLYIDLILFNLIGHIHYKLPTNNPRNLEYRTLAKNFSNIQSPLDYNSKFGPLMHYKDFPFEDSTVTLDCLWSGIFFSFLIKQYYLHRDSVSIRPEEGDVVIDGGACFGDNALAFAVSVGQSGKVYSFDPIQTHCDIVSYNSNQNPLYKHVITPVPLGLADYTSSNVSSIISNKKIQPGFSLHRTEQDESLPVTTIDEFVNVNNIPKVDFIKMDIEGFELKALKGARQTIEKFKPKLAICAYHQPQDFYEISKYVNSLDLGYSFYFDHYTIFNEETVLYGHVDRR